MARLARPLRAAVPWLILTLAGCGRSPPSELGGFGLRMSQEQVVAESRARTGSTCHLTGTRPRLTVCQGFDPGGDFRVVVLDDAITSIRIRLEPEGRRPQRAVRRFVKKFGDPVWRERPYHSPLDPAAGYHTLWLSRDSTRSLALICADRGLAPPCFAELTRTSPTAVEAKLDTLLGIRR
jgi:hypothetical protein